MLIWIIVYVVIGFIFARITTWANERWFDRPLTVLIWPIWVVWIFWMVWIGKTRLSFSFFGRRFVHYGRNYGR